MDRRNLSKGQEQEMGKKRVAESKQSSETLPEGLASTCSMLAVGLFMLTFVFQNFVIPSSSMASTLLVGDHVVVERETLAPAAKWAPFMPYREVHRGDIVVFYKPTVEPNGEHIFLVKRVIGTPGDHIRLRNGIVYLNGVAQNEPETSKPDDTDGNPNHAYNPYRDDFPSVTPSPESGLTATWALDLPTHIQGDDLVVPPGMIFAMGDNRLESL